MSESYSLISFIYDRYTRGVVISANPLLDEDGLRRFEEIVANTSIYLEYGIGGSTLFASQHAKLVVSVGSDGLFLAAVKKS
jgi:hypothetical protein